MGGFVFCCFVFLLCLLFFSACIRYVRFYGKRACIEKAVGFSSDVDTKKVYMHTGYDVRSA